MNPNLTEIAYILDRSGSMKYHQLTAIGGFNEFLKQQLEVPGDVRFTLVLFDHQYLMPVAAAPLADVPKLDVKTHVPRGRTALLDAIGETIDTLGRRLTTTPEQEHPGKVVVVIFTDGFENASWRFTWNDISERIQHQREKYGWEFMFLGANQDAIAAAARLGVSTEFASDMDASDDGLYAAKMAVSRKVSSMRWMSMGRHTADANVSMCENGIAGRLKTVSLPRSLIWAPVAPTAKAWSKMQ